MQRAQTAPKGQFKGTLDIFTQTVKKEGPLALYKGMYLAAQSYAGGLRAPIRLLVSRKLKRTGMMSPLLGIAAVNSLLFTAYGASRRLVSPYPDLSVKQVMLAGSMAGAVNAVLASPVCLYSS